MGRISRKVIIFNSAQGLVHARQALPLNYNPSHTQTERVLLFSSISPTSCPSLGTETAVLCHDPRTRRVVKATGFSFSALPRTLPEERPIIRGGNLSKSLAVSINFDFILFITSISEKFDPFPLFKKRLQTSIFIEFWQIYGLGSGIWFSYFPRSQFCGKHFKG